VGFIAAPAKPDKPHVFVPKGSLDGMRAAIRAADATPFRVHFSGDSVTHGGSVSGAGDWRLDSFPYMVRADLLDHYGLADGAEYFNISEAQNGMVANYASAGYVGSGGTGIGPWAFTAAYSGSEDGFFRRPTFAGTATMTTPGTEYVKFYAPPGTTRLEMLDWAPRVTAPFTWRYVLNPPNLADLSVGAVTVTYGSNTPTISKRTIYDSAARGDLVLYAGHQSTSQAMQLIGMNAYKDAARGLHFARIAWPGKSMAHLTRADLIPGDKPGVLFKDSQGLGFPFGPHLLVLAWGINDNVEADPWLSPSRFRRALARCVEAYRSYRIDGSVIILGLYYSVAAAYGDAGGFSKREGWMEYLRAMRDVAEQWNCAYVDIHAKWGPLAFSQGFASASGDAHASLPAGHRSIADSLMDAITAKA
jgi:hypothetical protein